MGIIYVLTCHITDEKYIGSTIDTLNSRYSKHKYESKQEKKCVSRNIINRGNHSIKPLEENDITDKRELEKREQYWMNIIPNINHKRAFRTEEERITQNREQAKKNYYANYEKVRKGDRRRKAWRRSWKPDGRMGFYNDLLQISIDLFN